MTQQDTNFPVNAWENMFKQELNGASAKAFHGLVETHERKKLPEHIFKDYFLPFFLGGAVPDPNTEVYARWVGIAETPTSEVDVINPAGDVLFTVPALMNTNCLEVLRDRHQSPPVMSLFKDYEQASLGLAPVAMNMLARGLQDKALDIVNNQPPQASDVEKWEYIRNYYGLSNSQSNTTNQSSVANEPDLEFDSL